MNIFDYFLPKNSKPVRSSQIAKKRLITMKMLEIQEQLVFQQHQLDDLKTMLPENQLESVAKIESSLLRNCQIVAHCINAFSE